MDAEHKRDLQGDARARTGRRTMGNKGSSESKGSDDATYVDTSDDAAFTNTMKVHLARLSECSGPPPPRAPPCATC